MRHAWWAEGSWLPWGRVRPAGPAECGATCVGRARPTARPGFVPTLRPWGGEIARGRALSPSVVGAHCRE